MDESKDSSDTDSIDRVKEVVWAADVRWKSKTTEVQLTALDHRRGEEQLQIELLIDLGVYMTLLMEEQWNQVQERELTESQSSRGTRSGWSHIEPAKHWRC